ncbi:MAG: nucleotide exchange factor GrpE [Planctomycetota bacterium]|nr:MAG: nucleotide exchange factor GrpE [Planctomycetota bacterium]REJ88972.1 MAG: nucleotide exchange factor GrpE [Planctomycetota bacterium]REK31220.1 MAG: nucleotide exchange factor GrpE [Planctomycetota bacterium]REK43558.1 MAG: nucleotide exchange factor GrpE [Planctomycetota bacterium]
MTTKPDNDDIDSARAADEAPTDDSLAEELTEASDAGGAASEIDVLRAELAEAKQRLVRGQADLDNFRKRAARELESERRYAALPLLADLLPVADNIQRAIAAAEESEHEAGLLEGFRMVADQLTSVLEKHHCREIVAHGETFDPNLHEAISLLPSAEHEPNTVMEVTSTGYTLHDRVVRPSQVVVAAEKPKEA